MEEIEAFDKVNQTRGRYSATVVGPIRHPKVFILDMDRYLKRWNQKGRTTRAKTGSRRNEKVFERKTNHKKEKRRTGKDGDVKIGYVNMQGKTARKLK